MHEIRKATDEKIVQVLTADQKEKFQTMREEQKAKMEASATLRANRKCLPIATAGNNLFSSMRPGEIPGPHFV